ncbi:hypothetical protein PLICRDRAFT_37340 [Plicaturopsis crispa FD-325 SS-3]|nr:hypothetical protein PLICRDRAFT_37340 [Plicaturopsis crispa FD-325 SS-3]
MRSAFRLATASTFKYSARPVPRFNPLSYTTMATTDAQSKTNLEPDRKYTAREERKWNRLGDAMGYFHGMFKQEFNSIYELADGSFNKRGLSLPRYLNEAKQLYAHLNVHHQIEEAHLFPTLAKRMPNFAMGGHGNGEHIKSHKAIHEGLDKLSALIDKWSKEPSAYSPKEMRECLDSFRDVLFRHLDEEVEDLSGENMKKYWKLEEVERIAI